MHFPHVPICVVNLDKTWKVVVFRVLRPAMKVLPASQDDRDATRALLSIGHLGISCKARESNPKGVLLIKYNFTLKSTAGHLIGSLPGFWGFALSDGLEDEKPLAQPSKCV
jgi:hypothetical protein